MKFQLNIMPSNSIVPALEVLSFAEDIAYLNPPSCVGTKNSMVSTLPNVAHPIVHSDRGCHYRWPGWIKRIEDSQLIRSMSKKDCSPDNAACEAFFGRFKNEMFYNHNWTHVTIDEFIDAIDNYMHWHSTKRIKISLEAMSPMEYRRSLGLVS